jgi:hypothetical protein
MEKHLDVKKIQSLEIVLLKKFKIMKQKPEKIRRKVLSFFPHFTCISLLFISISVTEFSTLF